MRYITLVKLGPSTITGTGLVSEPVGKTDEVRRVINQHNGKLSEDYTTKGRFDRVLVTDFDKPEHQIQAMLAIKTRFPGWVTETLDGNPSEQFDSLLASTKEMATTRA